MIFLKQAFIIELKTLSLYIKVVSSLKNKITRISC